MSKKYNILISANHCAPGQGSEHGVGWNFVSRLAEFHNITLITNRHDFYDRLCTEAEKIGIKVYGIKQYIKFKGLTKLLPFIYYSEYKWWQYRVYKKARQLHRENNFDLIHQVTNITFREPGYLWKLNAPFVWGPVVILGYESPRFLNMYGFSEGLKIILRHIFTNSQYSSARRVRKALNASSACLPVCDDTKLLLRALSPGTKFHIMPETASIDEKITGEITKREPGDEIRLLWISRFDPSKGVMLLLKALVKLPAGIKYKLILAGDGPQKNKAIAFCENKKINYEYLGHLSYDEIQKLYASAHLFFITSMMDATTTVLYEAFENGLPVIALDHLSFGEQIFIWCGKRITVGTQEQISFDIAYAIKYYYENEDERRFASEGALLQAEANSWNARIRKLCKIYDEILNSSTR